MSNAIYRIDINSCEDALGVIHAFMKDDKLTNPECTIFGDGSTIGGFPNILMMYDGRESMPSYTDFIKQTKRLGFSAISCVSATDPEDKRRVTLSYIPDLDFIAVSFPMAKNGINAIEEQLLERMSK